MKIFSFVVQEKCNFHVINWLFNRSVFAHLADSMAICHSDADARSSQSNHVWQLITIW